MSEKHVTILESTFIDSHPQESKYSHTDYSITWKNIIFIPFKKLWQYLIMTSVVVNALYVIYNITYTTTENESIADTVLYYTAWLLYFIDTTLSLAHRNMPQYRKIQAHKPKSAQTLILDTISLIPFYETYVLVKEASRKKVQNRQIKNIFRTQSLIRIHPMFTRALFVFSEIKTSNIITSITLTHFMKLVLLAHIIAAVWYSQSCWKCDNPNWTNDLKDLEFKANSSSHWLIISYCTVADTLIHNWSGRHSGNTTVEKLIMLTTMLFGFILHYLSYLGALLIAYLKMHRMQLISVDKLNDIKNYLVYSKVDKEWYDKTIAYYRYLWRERSGMKDMPEMFWLLPVQLQKEVAVDIYWEALRHSHLFRDHSLAFKRALSLAMKNEFFLPGDYVYKVREIKNKMIYVVSGILQVLTQEDEESPIMSFSSGTVLGEFACFFPSKSVVNVRCATYCELHALEIRNLDKVLGNYPREAKTLHQRLRDRVEKARFVNDFVKTKPNTAIIKKEDTCVKFIKRQWRELSKLNDVPLNSVTNLKILSTPYHTSEYLNLLVLTKDIELKTKAICLRGSCPFVFNTKSSFRLFLHCLVLLSVLMQCLLVPYHLTFHREMPEYISPACFILDLVYVFHIYLELSTAVRKPNYLIISASSSIAMEKMRQVTFMIDIVATIPLDYFAYLLEAPPYICALLKLNRLLRFYAIIQMFHDLERSIWCNILYVKMAKYVFLNAIIAYWIACVVSPKTGIVDESKLNTYHMLSLFFGTPMGYTSASTPDELVCYHQIKLLGYYVFTLCVAEICSVYIERLHKHKNYKYFLHNMKDFLKSNKISSGIKNHVCRIMHFWWYLNKNREALGEDGILTDASPEIKRQVLRNRLIACVKSVPLFAMFNREEIDCIVNNCKIKTLPAGAPITTCGKRTSTFYFVLQGYCEMKSEMAGDHHRNSTKVLTTGSAFPVVEVLHGVDCLTSIVTATAVEVLCLKIYFFTDVVNSKPSLKADLSEALKKHYQENKHLLYLNKSRLPAMVPVERSFGKKDMFKYKLCDVESNVEEVEYQTPFRQLGKWGFIRYLFLRNTIYPETKGYFWYECFRCLVITIRIFLVFLHFNVLIDCIAIVEWFYVVVSILTMIDFYIRMHCQYYTEAGILVTHPWYTAKHYVKTSFLVDAITMIPIRYIKLDHIIGHRQKEMVFCFVSLITKPWQLYRVFGLITYIHSKLEKTSKYLQTIKYVILVTVFLCSFALIIKMYTCKILITKAGNIGLFCNKSSWLYRDLHRIRMTSSVIYLKCLYVTVIFFTTSTSGSITATTRKEIAMFTTIAVLIFALRVFIYAKTISHKVRGNVKLTLYQERVNSFLRFIQDEYVDDELIKETIGHYQYIWDRTQGNDFKSTFDRFNSVLHKDLFQSIYGNTMHSVRMLENIESSFLRDILIEMETMHFKKDSQIIRCNDIQGSIFIVHTGIVEVRIAKSTVCSLGTGGIFGCFEKTGMTRQTIEAIAQVHVTVLTVTSKLFHRVVNKYPEFKRKLLGKNVLHFEYEEGLVEPSTVKQTWSMEKGTFIGAIHAKSNILINENQEWYQWWKYVVYVHLASISSLGLMIFIGMLTPTHKLTATTKSAIYLFDVIFYVKIFFEFHLSYEDAESGILITDFNLIRNRYTKSLQIWIDVFTCFPFEVIAGFITTDQTAIKYCIFNRIFRFIYLNQYYNLCRDKVYVKMHLHRTYLFYWFCISLQLMTCIWWLTACPDQRCYYSNSTSSNKEFVKTEPGISSLMCAYAYVVNLFTTTGFMDSVPMTALEIVVSILILFVFQMSTIALISQFTSSLELRQYSQSTYEYQIKTLHTYLQQQDLSPALADEVSNYGCNLWTLHGGVWMPDMIINAPRSLQQDLMHALYGYHINNHFLFKDTHTDFLRQLVVHLKRCLFFPRNYLVSKDDIDGSMYFIHQGTVEVLEVRGGTTLRLLHKNNTFGEEQLLYNTCHSVSYKAKTVVDVLVLKRSDWSYLLEWFPASSAAIFNSAREYCINPRH